MEGKRRRGFLPDARVRSFDGKNETERERDMRYFQSRASERTEGYLLSRLTFSFFFETRTHLTNGVEPREVFGARFQVNL